ncbi:MAG: hypothetical protein ATN32_08980 [Candidatus Epulonipiscium fishelsonii]|nr:MAG: hypothetical protein ATN32_08980 [Epulopiscium sp. AS2M-Bin002]
MEQNEWLFYNAAMGARFRSSSLTDKSTIAYLKSDNSYKMTGIFHTDDKTSDQLRYKYSPTHQDAAVCCVPNAGRIYNYFLEYMWYTQGNTLIKTMYGPSELSTNIDGNEIIIRETSRYPFENILNFEVKTPIDITIKLRIPSFAINIKCTVPFIKEDNFITIKTNKDSCFKVEFEAAIEIKTDFLGDIYFKYGACLYCLDYPIKEDISKNHPLEGFYDIHCVPLVEIDTTYKVSSNIKPILKKVENNTFISVETLTNNILLKPIAKTVLRKVTFKRQ